MVGVEAADGPGPLDWRGISDSANDGRSDPLTVGPAPWPLELAGGGRP